MDRLARTKEVYREFDVAVDRIVHGARAKGWPIPCKKGCDACCSDVAVATTMEVEVVVARVRAMPKEQQKQIRTRLQEWIRRAGAAGIDPEDAEPDLQTYHRAKLVCPLLDTDEHVCTVYEDRPLACRGHVLVGTDASPCANRANVPVIDSLIVTPEVGRALQYIAQAHAEENGELLMSVGLLPAVLYWLWVEEIDMGKKFRRASVEDHEQAQAVFKQVSKEMDPLSANFGPSLQENIQKVFGPCDFEQLGKALKIRKQKDEDGWREEITLEF